MKIFIIAAFEKIGFEIEKKQFFVFFVNCPAEISQNNNV